MTCIVGLVSKGKVYMGGDSAGASGWLVRAVQSPKVFKVGAFIIGYTTSFRMGEILQYHLDVEPQKEEQADHEYMVCHFAEAVRKALKEHGFAKVENNVEEGGDFLVGYRGHLYSVNDDFQMTEHVENYDACGCGQEFALGAIKALEDWAPEERIRRALEIAAYFSGGVLPPFHIVGG